MIDPTDPSLWVNKDGTININAVRYEVVLHPDGTVDALRKADGFVISITGKAVGHLVFALLNKVDDYMDGVFVLVTNDETTDGRRDTDKSYH